MSVCSPYDALASWEDSEKSNKQFPRKFGKQQFCTQNCSFGPVSMETKLLSEKRVMSVSSPYGSLTSWKVSDKNSEWLTKF